MRFKITLTFPPVQPEIARTAEYIKQALARVGIDVELRNIDIATFIRQVYTLGLRPDPELPLPAAGPDARGAAALHQRQHQEGHARSPTRRATRTRTWTRPSTAAQTENDQAKRKELFARAQRQIQEDLPALILFEMSFITLYNRASCNHTMGADGPYGSFRDTYFQP